MCIRDRAIALGAAVDYLSALGMENIHAYEQELVDYVLPKLQAIDGLTVYGPEDSSQHAGVIAFNIDGLHPVSYTHLPIPLNVKVPRSKITPCCRICPTELLP